MTHVSPAALLTWSVMSTMMLAFFIGHLWKFDRFKCLRWSSGPYTGAFKRFMTYTYMLTIPLLMTYSYGYTYIKYMEGYSDIPELGIVPKPYTLWPEKYQRAIFPLNLLFSFAWSLEMITHLEELCFWLFLVTAGPSQIYWFKSIYFRVWVLGSIVALVYVPVIAITTRANPLQCEANIFLAGSLGDLVLTVAFIPILWSFPAFLNKIKREGVNGEVMVRLRTFHEMNVTRVIFRSIFVGSLLALGIDGVRGHVHHLNEIPFWTDIFVIAAAIGCAISSALTVLIFFPRSIGDEYEAHHASNQIATQPSNSKARHHPNTHSSPISPHPHAYPHAHPHDIHHNALYENNKLNHTTSATSSQLNSRHRARANSSSTVITGKLLNPRFGAHANDPANAYAYAYGYEHDHPGMVGVYPEYGIPIEMGEMSEGIDMAKFPRSPTVEHSVSSTFLLMDTTVKDPRTLPQDGVALDNGRRVAFSSRITGAPVHAGVHPEVDVTQPIDEDNVFPEPSPDNETDYDFDRRSQSFAQRTWRVHNRASGVDGVATRASSSSTEVGKKRNPDDRDGDEVIGGDGSASVVSFDSLQKLRPSEYPSSGLNANPKRLSRGKRVGDKLTQENVQWHNAHSSRINPLIYRFMSPIDFMEDSEPYASRRQSLQQAYAHGNAV